MGPTEGHRGTRPGTKPGQDHGWRRRTRTSWSPKSDCPRGSRLASSFVQAGVLVCQGTVCRSVTGFSISIFQTGTSHRFGTDALGSRTERPDTIPNVGACRPRKPTRPPAVRHPYQLTGEPSTNRKTGTLHTYRHMKHLPFLSCIIPTGHKAGSGPTMPRDHYQLSILPSSQWALQLAGCSNAKNTVPNAKGVTSLLTTTHTNTQVRTSGKKRPARARTTHPTRRRRLSTERRLTTSLALPRPAAPPAAHSTAPGRSCAARPMPGVPTAPVRWRDEARWRGHSAPAGGQGATPRGHDSARLRWGGEGSGHHAPSPQHSAKRSVR